ncbi:kinase-like protein [Rhizophagus irregularis]|uniref:Kinase-like protein n=1 Tax=Rhizophagus irregularis TaxID=588596 RepID=A0A2N1NX09_9GLOM|nr:kinase-like protein [Rhizophagus irregularis]
MHQVFSDLVSLSMNENTLLAEGSTDTGGNIIEQKINNSLSSDQSSYNSQIIKNVNYVPSQEVTNGNDLKIIMTGIEGLKDLDVNNTVHYKQINIKPSLEDENYEVFGSVILKNNLRLEDILISFELHVYDFNGFSVIIKPLNNADIDITKCYLLWMIIGSSPKLSAFSPRNRELQVYCIKESIALKPTNSYYSIKTSCQLFQGYTISVNVYCPTANHKLINLKINIVGWSEYCIYFRIAKSNYNNLNSDSSSDSTESHDGDTDFLTNVEITICILSSNYENLSIDNMEGKEYSLASIGHCLTENTKIIPSINVNELGSEHLQEMEAGIKKNDVVLYPLKLTDYERDDKEKPRKNGHVTKWVSLKNKNEEFAFKIISEEEINDIQNQIVILKELHDWQNITRIYGLTCEGKDWFWVSEWAKYGNLREYYTNYKDRFDVRLKLRMSLDIARGLNFLRTVEILHHDIRAENILITLHETAKLANFKSCHSLFTTTLNQSQNLERVRYCAPELLEMAHNFKYDYNCEIYSFGILLWEIAEERTPYEQYNDSVKITDLVRNQKYREPFSKDSQTPLSFTSLALKGL